MDRLCKRGLDRLLFAALLSTAALPGHAQATPPAIAECLAFAAKPPDISDRAAFERGLKTWMETCRQAATADPQNPRVKVSLAHALSAHGERAEAIELLRQAAAQNDPEVLWELYELYKSYYRTLGRPQLVTREEAERSLRKAAELGHSYATWMLAILLDRGSTVKRDPAGAITWAEKALANSPKDTPRSSIEIRLGHFLTKSTNPEQRARGIQILERYAQGRGQGEAQAYLAEAIRGSDPERARKLLEEATRSYPGHAIPALTDMLLKGEGGPKDEKRALAMLKRTTPSDPASMQAALGQLYLEGRLVPKDVTKAIGLLRPEAQWSIDAQVRLMALLREHPDVSITNPEGFLYGALEAAQLGEPGMMDALIDLNLSANAQFADKPGGCKLAREAAARGDAHAKDRFQECGQN